jgi:hypothetical protein
MPSRRLKDQVKEEERDEEFYIQMVSEWEAMKENKKDN